MDHSISAKIDLSLRLLKCDIRLVMKNKVFVWFWLGKDMLRKSKLRVKVYENERVSKG